MNIEGINRRTVLSWLFVGALFTLCGVLGVLQYRWIDEVSRADRLRLRATLQGSLSRISRDFNAGVTAACAALLPAGPSPGAMSGGEAAESDYAARYVEWRKTARYGRIFSRIVLARRHGQTLVLRSLDPDRGVFQPTDWPAGWTAVRQRLEARFSPGSWPPRPPGPPAFSEEDDRVLELPRFVPRPPSNPPAPFQSQEAEWLLVELNLPYVRDVFLPELVRRHLGSGGSLEYQVEVASKRHPASIIYASDPGKGQPIGNNADASAGLFDLQFDQIFRRFAPPGGRGAGPGPGRVPSPDAGRWQISVRHHAGSLEAVVSSARWRNLLVTAGILLLMLVTAAALIRFTRHAERLAEMQMNFVAGVSHELRTPLTVIQTAAYNLRDGVATTPGQVERYGALIQQESERLGKLVEQVLRFANTNAGHPIRETEPVSVESVIDESLESSRPEIESAHCAVEKRVAAGLPLVLADPLALKHAVANLVTNAVKYGTGSSNWIGVSALRGGGESRDLVEIRVADRGPGIPEDEQRHIFDPFFRGRQALRDQVHGSGLGLNLAKRIVEAHGGTIEVRSQPRKGTEFVVRIPAAPREQQDELTYSLSRG